jgi:hypothetical protein
LVEGYTISESLVEGFMISEREVLRKENATTTFFSGKALVVVRDGVAVVVISLPPFPNKNFRWARR